MSEPNLKEILTAVKAALQTAFDDTIREESIYITPELSYIPDAVSPPCIGITDGDIGYRYPRGRGTLREGDFTLQFGVFSDLLRGDDAIMGYLADKGLIDMVSDLHAALDDNRLGIRWIAVAECTGESKTRMFGDSEFIQQKIVTYTYKTLGKRPGAARI